MGSNNTKISVPNQKTIQQSNKIHKTKLNKLRFSHQPTRKEVANRRQATVKPRKKKVILPRRSTKTPNRRPPLKSTSDQNLLCLTPTKTRLLPLKSTRARNLPQMQLDRILEMTARKALLKRWNRLLKKLT